MDRDLGKPQTSQASTRIRAASGHADKHDAEQARNAVRAANDPSPTIRLAFIQSRPSIAWSADETNHRLGFDMTHPTASSKAHDKDGTFKKEFTR